MAPNWCKIDVEIGPCQSKKIDVIRVRLGLVYRSGRSRDWLKFKNPAAAATYAIAPSWAFGSVTLLAE